MLSIDVIFSYDLNLFVPVRTRATNDLSVCVKGCIYWVNFLNNQRSAYHLTSKDNVKAPVEFINHHWHFIIWKGEQGYVTNLLCLIEKHQFGTRWYNKQEPSLISPLTLLDPPLAYDSPSMGTDTNSPPCGESEDDTPTRRNYNNEVLAQRAKLFIT
jgi:hypothetical protein